LNILWSHSIRERQISKKIENIKIFSAPHVFDHKDGLKNWALTRSNNCLKVTNLPPENFDPGLIKIIKKIFLARKRCKRNIKLIEDIDYHNF